MWLYSKVRIYKQLVRVLFTERITEKNITWWSSCVTLLAPQHRGTWTLRRTSYCSDLAVSWGTRAKSSAMAWTTPGCEWQLSSGQTLLHAEIISTTWERKIYFKTRTLEKIQKLWSRKMMIPEFKETNGDRRGTSARHSSCSPCRTRAAGVARSGLLHCFKVSEMAATMSPACW